MLLGLGVSGPQVVEGWHGVPYGKPLVRTREYVEILHAILKRESPLEHHGEHYDIPVRGGTGLGKPLKLIIHPLRDRIPIYLAAIGPKNVALAAEIADGWLPIFFSPQRMNVCREWIGDRDLATFDIAPERDRGARSGRRRMSQCGEAAHCVIRRRNGRARPQFLFQSGLPLRLRGRRAEDSGFVSRRQEGRSCSRRAGRAGG